MKQGKLKLVALFFLIFCLSALPLTGEAQPVKSQPAKPRLEAPPPTDDPDYITARNVSIYFERMIFGSGMRLDPQTGKPNGRGEEILIGGGCGSGFIIKEDGTIATNYHVVRRAQRAQAIFEDGSKFDITHARVADLKNDIAIIKLKAGKKFPTMNLGNSDRLRLMDEVRCVGNTLCKDLSITKGTINRLEKDEATNRLKYIRHDAAMAGGNSGGALILIKEGTAVGINVASDRRTSQMHFAIPINKLKLLMGDKKYENELYLPNVFPRNLASIETKRQSLNSMNGQIRASTEKELNYIETQYRFVSLIDYEIILRGENVENLALEVYSPLQERTIGLSSLIGQSPKKLLISADYDIPVILRVYNFNPTPSKFALEIYFIDW